MRSIGSVAAVLVLLASSAQAHFTVQHPPPIKPFDDDGEASAPCGGYTPSPADVKGSEFHVDGDTVATTLTHPEATFLYRITTDLTAGGNWSQAYPMIQQNGAGTYCNPKVTVSHDFIGKTAIFGIVAKGPDGMLYQCSAVNFVEGTADAQSDCTNATGVSATYTSDSDLTSQLGNPSASPAEHVPSGGVSNKSGTFQGVSAMVTVGLMAFLGVALLV
ncbi:hypothetical protein GGR52DRAFT_558789 [Hypoxylon sp. FL1284]|nr:hypothetical protein GGR52DRAFT_558789 [Hypoxylon sp. FL1284]